MALDMNCDPPKHFNLLTTLEEAGQSEYPDLAPLAYVPATPVEERMAIAMKACQNLVIRLLVWCPFRTRHGVAGKLTAICAVRTGVGRFSFARKK
jgi:hypothetical protein